MAVAFPGFFCFKWRERWCSPAAKAARALKQWCLGACVSDSARIADKGVPSLKNDKKKL